MTISLRAMVYHEIRNWDAEDQDFFYKLRPIKGIADAYVTTECLRNNAGKRANLKLMTAVAAIMRAERERK